MGGFNVEPPSLVAAADAIDAATDSSGLRGYELVPPRDTGADTLDRACVQFTTGWNGAARQLALASDDLATGLRSSASAYLAIDAAREAVLGALLGKSGTGDSPGTPSNLQVPQ